MKLPNWISSGEQPGHESSTCWDDSSGEPKVAYEAQKLPLSTFGKTQKLLDKGSDSDKFVRGQASLHGNAVKDNAKVLEGGGWTHCFLFREWDVWGLEHGAEASHGGDPIHVVGNDAEKIVQKMQGVWQIVVVYGYPIQCTG